MSRDFLKGFVFGFCLLFVGITFFMWYQLQDDLIEPPKKEQTIEEKYVEKMDLLMDYVDSVYIGEYTKEELLEASYKGLIAGLGDKYSAYFPPAEFEVEKDSMKGSFYGIGVYVGINKDGYAVITEPLKGGPAYKAGLLEGDIILEADGKSMVGVDLNTAVSYVRGDKDTSVRLKIQREGEVFEIDIVRGEVSKETVTFAMLEGNIGYIKVAKFDEQVNKYFKNALDELQKQNAKGIIIDLRNNPGGYLGEACAMLECFVPKGELLVYQMDKNQKRTEQKSTTDDTVDTPIVILMNGNSASASEVFTGCLLDYNNQYVKLTTVGENSFGKGIVQTQHSLADGSAIKLTSAKYYSPKGTNIHGKGFMPDIEVVDDPETEIDEQLQAAIEVFKK